MKVLNKKQNILLVVIVVILIVSCVMIISELSEGGTFSAKPGESQPTAIDVSIISLITNPKKYDGKLVKVSGVGCIEADGNALYLSKEDYKYIVQKNAVFLDFTNAAVNKDDAMKLNGKYVYIEGIFNADNNGVSDLYTGAIENIKKYDDAEIYTREK